MVKQKLTVAKSFCDRWKEYGAALEITKNAINCGQSKSLPIFTD